MHDVNCNWWTGLAPGHLRDGLAGHHQRRQVVLGLAVPVEASGMIYRGRTRFLRGFLRYAIPSADRDERALKFSYCTYAGMGNTKEISLNLYSHHDFKNIFKMFHNRVQNRKGKKIEI
jgi:hypothetical protein